MILANVNVGSGPNVGDGDLLRNAFVITNNNSTIVQANVTELYANIANVTVILNNTITAQSNLSTNANVANVAANVTAISSNYVTTNTAQTITSPKRFSSTTLTPVAGVTTVNFNNANFVVDLDAGVNSFLAANIASIQRGIIEVIHSGSAIDSVSFSSDYIFDNGSAITVPTTAGRWVIEYTTLSTGNVLVKTSANII